LPRPEQTSAGCRERFKPDPHPKTRKPSDWQRAGVSAPRAPRWRGARFLPPELRGPANSAGNSGDADHRLRVSAQALRPTVAGSAFAGCRRARQSEGKYKLRPGTKYLTATNVAGDKLLLFNFATRHWSELAKATIGSFEWSADSKFVYFDNGVQHRPGGLSRAYFRPQGGAGCQLERLPARGDALEHLVRPDPTRRSTAHARCWFPGSLRARLRCTLSTISQ
jgi:hypothetical protein